MNNSIRHTYFTADTALPEPGQPPFKLAPGQRIVSVLPNWYNGKTYRLLIEEEDWSQIDAEIEQLAI
jgi:hypothetical protein